MKLQQETENLISEAVKEWDRLKEIEKIKPEEYGCGFYSKIGFIYWDNPNLLWLFMTNNEEGYDGSQTQIGLAKDGRIMWEYQSHCSCNDYENSNENGQPIPEDTTKIYELEYLPKEWEGIVQFNLKKILNGKN